MLTHTQSFQPQHVLLPLVVLFLFFPFFSHAQTAVGNNGWINFGTSLLSGNSGCDDDPDEKKILESFVIKDIPANVDIGEVEASLLINGVKANIAMATISVFDTVTGEIVNSVTGTGPVIGEVCYNPDTQGVSVRIDGGEYYHDFYHARVWKNPATVTRNVFVQSTIWLRERSDTLKEYAHVSPVGTIVNTDPEYKIDLQYTPNVDIGSYEASQRSVDLSIVAYDTYTDTFGSAVYSDEINLMFGNGTQTITPRSIPEGWFVWAYYFNLKRPHGDSNGIITSGFSGYDWPFLYDKTAPTISSRSATPSGGSVTLEAGATDALSGLSHIKIYVDSQLSRTCSYESSQSALCNTIMYPTAGFETGTSHTYFIVVSDSAGNTATSSPFDFDMPESTGDNLVVTNIAPIDNSTFNANGAITFQGSAQNLSGTDILEGGYAGLEIDWDANGGGEGSAYDDYYGIPNNATLLGGFTLNEAKNFEYTLSNISVGTHRYRFSVSALSDGGGEASRTEWTTFNTIAGNLEVSSSVVDGGETVDLSWNTEGSDLTDCSVEGGGQTWNGLEASNQTTNPLNSDTTYILSCRGIPLDSETVTVNAEPEITIVPRIVPKGATSTIMWNTHNGDEGSCTLRNGPTTINHIPSTEGDPNTGYATIVVEGRSRYALTCPTGVTTFEVEIVPTAFEI